MKKEQFKEGTIIKGKDLKGYTLCMILPEDMVICGFQYNIGENDCDDGSYFCFIKDICRDLHYIYRTVPGCTQVEYGSKLAIVSIPDNEDVYVCGIRFSTHKLKIERVMSLGNIETWEYLHESGADIISDEAIKCAANNGPLNVVKYLHENGADIKACTSLFMCEIKNDKIVSEKKVTTSNQVIVYAAMNGQLDIVKYLHENGADIEKDDNNALEMAARNGHLDVVKYLHENGADVDKCSALEVAATHNHMDVVKYLYENGASIKEHCSGMTSLILAERGELEALKYLHENGMDIMVADGAAILWAVCAGHLDVVKYLYEHRTEGILDSERIEEFIESAKENGYLDIAEYLQKQSMQN